MSVLTLSLSHHSAPLDLRGRFAFAPEQLPQALRSLRERLSRAAPEVTLLSTCNRTELYVAAADGAAANELVRPALDWLAEQGGASSAALQQHTRVAEHCDAARHAFRVAAGLDSMVLGEPQILGQIKLAVREAGLAGTMGSTLHQLFQRAFSVAKEVRSATDIGAHSVSMSAAAVRLAQQLFGDLQPGARALRRCRRDGRAGRGALCRAQAAVDDGGQPQRRSAASRWQSASAAKPSAWRRCRSGCTSSTSSSPAPPARCRSSAWARWKVRSSSAAAGRCSWSTWRCRATSSPRWRACPTCISTPSTTCRTLVQSGGEKRQAAVAQAEAIVDAGVRGFAHWLEQRHNVPLIREVNARADAWRDAELARARRQLARGEDMDAVLESLARGLTAKVLHGTLSELRHTDDEHRAEVSSGVAAVPARRVALGRGLRHDGRLTACFRHSTSRAKLTLSNNSAHRRQFPRSRCAAQGAADECRLSGGPVS